MAPDIVEHVEVAPEGFQAPRLVLDAALAPNRHDEPDVLLVDRQLLPEIETFFGSKLDSVHWAWTFRRTAKKRDHTGGVERAVALVERTKGDPEARPPGALAADWEAEQRTAVWDDQRHIEPDDGLNPTSRRWRPSRRTYQPPPSYSGFRFVAEEELTGRIEGFHPDGQTAFCRVWRRRAAHDPYDAELVLSEFPPAQAGLIAEGAVLYWTFGQMIQPDGRAKSQSDLVLQRRTPVPPEQWNIARQQGRREAASYRKRRNGGGDFSNGR